MMDMILVVILGAALVLLWGVLMLGWFGTPPRMYEAGVLYTPCRGCDVMTRETDIMDGFCRRCWEKASKAMRAAKERRDLL